MASGGLRIVGGELRGRRLPVPRQPGLRPTPDRVRETLFNWLQPVIAGSRCLDLFAGSGALGLEARSRGAAHVVLIERVESVVRALRTTVRDWQLTGVEVRRADALRWLEGTPLAFDIVFLDPPFAAGLLGPACARLAAGGWLAAGAQVYLEAAAADGLPPLPADWALVREGRAGDVAFGLAMYDVPPAG
ncbi:16S rRNA (guanine(966)-N(2))-methyltransferase RsmD [Thiococcus pfennigii]|uniref:16S rRNA (guanine(966)-N(2))-methyltransferase RsmD n=1 Tax=Thiococcus pfennigii TaxID=1057 RepID=UPI00190893D1|nr:16S rRNA (guanine(966)-N(2))-methyltransferase RsmD [Thiococcus pfennigii]MBK1700270.1 16S rRNA (guanine(966)-N(2))-methyltransferase RsmD [Thiococcus pfennigii]